MGSAVTAQAMPTPATNCQVHALWSDPAAVHQHAGCGDAAEQQRRAECERRRDDALAAVLPGLAQVEFDTGDADEDHHAPTRRCR